jgi:hypothetical protein
MIRLMGSNVPEESAPGDGGGGGGGGGDGE